MQSDSPCSQTDVLSVYNSPMAWLSSALQQIGPYERKESMLTVHHAGRYGAADGAM